MFAHYDPSSTTKRRKRWTPTTIAISVLAHGAAIGAVVGLAREAEAKPMREEVIAEWNLEDKPKPPPPPPPVVQPEPPRVELAPREETPRLETPKVETPRERPAPAPRPAPVKGDFVSPKPPETPPAGIPVVNPNAVPITPSDFSGIGKEGDVVGAVDPSDHRAPTGHTEPAPPAPPAEKPAPEPEPAPSGPMEESEVDVRPSLRNADDMQRALERVYPSQLREAGVTGETVLQFVIDENGRVEPGSVEVVSSSDEAFSAAARRIVGSMRFSPAKARGRTVRVTTTIPVRWTIAS
ncbi:energy transducer TonB [Longimicrobium sp.]|uniref:energy transducer TonB n=1 Tax=Longimicrobium sp. TaxID=2029185 RepID=UPI002CBAFFFA|nr:energy transducer TonB [Longimicrobium sp.]HSU13641.1 energy transducer TonB [Longimicrobium sp.]